jgi:hypothetical protein
MAHPRERFAEGIQIGGCGFAIDKSFHSVKEARAFAARQ